jgi:hypothetical protein
VDDAKDIAGGEYVKKWVKKATISFLIIGLLAALVYAVSKSSTATQPDKTPEKSLERPQDKDEVTIPKESFLVETKGTEGEKTAKKTPAYIMVNKVMFVGVTEALTMQGFTDIKLDSKTNTVTAVRNKGKKLTFEHVMGSDVIRVNGNQSKLSEKSKVVDGKMYASFEIYDVSSEFRLNPYERPNFVREKEHDHEHSGEPGHIDTDGHTDEHSHQPVESQSKK